jgi:hypothetical protein
MQRQAEPALESSKHSRTCCRWLVAVHHVLQSSRAPTSGPSSMISCGMERIWKRCSTPSASVTLKKSLGLLKVASATSTRLVTSEPAWLTSERDYRVSRSTEPVVSLLALVQSKRVRTSDRPHTFYILVILLRVSRCLTGYEPYMCSHASLIILQSLGG